MGLSADIWMPFYIGDYLASTQHLSAEQSGAYLHLLMHQWKTGPLPLDIEVLRRISRVDRDAWSSAWAMLEHFFKRTEAGYIQNRLEREKKISQEKQESTTIRAKNAAAKRWPTKTPDAGFMLDHPPSITQAMPEQCPSPSPSHKGKEQSALALTAIAVHAPMPFLTVPLIDGSEFPITEAKVAEWVALYLAVDVPQQLRAYRGWAINNPRKRKTRTGILKSINGWLADKQNQAGPTRGVSSYGNRAQDRTDDNVAGARKAFEAITSGASSLG
jgi:uncharacterized protein YdaU (DUF1376 family)